MDGGKFLLAGGLMVAGIGGAMSFRHDGGPPVAAAPAANSETMVRRVIEPIEAARELAPVSGLDMAARLTGRVEPHSFAGNRAVPQPRVVGEYALTGAVEPADGTDDRKPRHNRVLQASPAADLSAENSGRSLNADPPKLPAEGQFRARHAAVTSITADSGPSITAVDRTHVVRDGDTLGGLSQRYYGDSGRYREILEANREVLTSPDLLPIGVELRIPAATATSVPHASPPPAARIVPRLEFQSPGSR